MPLFVLLVAFLLLPVPAFASDWIYVSDSMYADRESIQPTSDGHRRMWMRKGGHEHETEMILYEFSCTGQYRIIEGKRWGYYSDTQVIPDTEKNWEYLKPDTVFMQAQKVACKK